MTTRVYPDEDPMSVAPSLGLPTTTKAVPYTPGPWVNDDTQKFYGKHVIRRNGVVVATIPPTSEYSMAPNMAESEANARLIAAAPEMFEALRLIARSEGFKDGTWVGELQEIARAAIAKAEGV